MSQIMVNKVSKLPDDVSVNKPIPSARGLKGGERLKPSDQKTHHTYGDEATDNAVKYVDQKGDFIHLSLWLFVDHSQAELEEYE